MTKIVKSKCCALITIFVLLFAVNGCEVLLIGGAAGGGYMLGKDKRPAGVIASDALITSSVKTALFQDDDIKALDINVDTYEGQVTLIGHVTSPALIDRAINIAKATKGVTSVKSHLVVIKPH